MRRAPFAFAALLALALPAAGPSTAASQPAETLRMAWEDCPLSGGAFVSEDFSCSTNLGSSSLFCAFSLFQPVDQVVGLELVVDIQHSESTLPDYWRLGPSPDCRHDLLTASVDFTGTFGCAIPGFTGAVMQDYLEGEPRGLPSQARIKTVVFVPSPQTLSLTTDSTYLAVRLAFSHDRTVNVNTCTGCVPSACLVLNSILIRRVAGAFGGDVFVSSPAPGNGNWAYWRSPLGGGCVSVPVRNMTWGTIKSLYR